MDLECRLMVQCEACDREDSNNCGSGTKCYNLPGSYYCLCSPGFEPVPRSNELPFPINCKEKRVSKEMSLVKPVRIPPNFLACDRAKYDIVIMVDGSRTVTDPSYRLVLRAVTKFIDYLEIGPYATQIAFVQYSRNIKVAFHLNDFANKKSLIQAVGNIPYSGFGTKTGLAIQKLQDEVLLSSRGRRQRNDLHVIIITDGKSADDVTLPASNLHKITSHVHVIGVSNHVDKKELRDIAGYDGRVTTYPNFKLLEQKMPAMLRNSICPSYGCSENNDYLDVIFALETTLATSGNLFGGMKKFALNVASQFNVGQLSTKVGAVTMGSTSSIEFFLDEHETGTEIAKALEQITHNGREPKLLLGKALQFIEANLLLNRKGRRPGAGLVMIVVTKGNLPDDFASAAASLKNQGAVLHIVGIGPLRRKLMEEISLPQGVVFGTTEATLNSTEISRRVSKEIKKAANCPRIFPPVGIQVHIINEKSIHVSWKSRTGVNSFIVYLYKGDGRDASSYIKQVRVTGNSYVFDEKNGFQPGTQYSVMVQTRRGRGGKNSNVVEFWTDPAQVTGNVKVVRLASNLQISFPPVVGNVDEYKTVLVNASTMEVLAVDTINVKKQKSVKDIIAVFQNNIPGKYLFLVTTVSGPKSSKPVPFDFLVDELEIPKNLKTVLSRTNMLGITWDSIKNVEGYLVELTGPLPGDSTFMIHKTSDPNYTFQKLSPANQYEIKVRSFINNMEQTSDYSRKHISNTAPLPITTLKPTMTSDGVRVKFVGVEKVDHYILSIKFGKDMDNKNILDKTHKS
ncbi:von Willebrand factor A domain-containing protein 2-like [Styela clava]